VRFVAVTRRIAARVSPFLFLASRLGGRIMEILRRELRIEATRADSKSRTVDAALSSDAPVERAFGFEVLSHNPGAVDLSRASPSLPLLFNHDVDQPIGSAERVRLETGKLRARLRFADTARGREIFQLVADGHLSGVSVGYSIEDMERTGECDGRDVFTALRWKLLETSVTPVPADHAGAGIGRSIETNTRGEITMQTEHHDGESVAAQIGELGQHYSRYINAEDTARALREQWSPDKFKELVMQRMESQHTKVDECEIGMTRREVERYSIVRAVVASITGDWREAGLERAASEASARKFGRAPEGFYVPLDYLIRGRRDFNIGTATEAGNLRPTDFRVDLYSDVYRPALTLAALGARILPGLSGNVDIPIKLTAGSVGLLTEVGSASETNPTTAKRTLTPHRIGAYIEPSKQALIQSGLALEPMLRDDLIQSGSVLIESQAINGAGTDAEMTGIRLTTGIGTVVGGANGATLAWSHLVGLESACADLNAEPGMVSGYLINSKVRAKCKTTTKATNLPFIWDAGDRPLNGYRAGVTSNVPANLTKGTSSTICSAVLFASDWSQAVLGLFGAPDVVVDPYTLAATGQVRITLNQYCDFAIRQPGAFAKMEDALTT